MNDSEKRRIRLLDQTRNQYSDRRLPPAIHPRYGAAYKKIYDYTDEGAMPSTFGIRLFLCCMLFAAFITMDNNQVEYKHVNSERIVQEITTDIDVEAVWNML